MIVALTSAPYKRDKMKSILAQLIMTNLRMSDHSTPSQRSSTFGLGLRP